MKPYRLTFTDRRTGRKTAMVVQAVSASNAQEVGTYFERSYGRLVTFGKDKPQEVTA